MEVELESESIAESVYPGLTASTFVIEEFTGIVTHGFKLLFCDRSVGRKAGSDIFLGAEEMHEGLIIHEFTGKVQVRKCLDVINRFPICVSAGRL